jgi:hypothetical protein
VVSQAKSSDSLGHLCRQLGSAQAHMGFGEPITLKSEMSQLSIDLTFSPLHSGQVRLGILSPIGLLVTCERVKGSVPFGAEIFRFRQGPLLGRLNHPHLFHGGFFNRPHDTPFSNGAY